jgi:predicted nucleotidyltransferase
VATARSGELRAVAQRVADAFPPEVEEVVLTGSVSRGVADEASDIEMLVVTRQQLSLDECFALARGAGLERLDTWGDPATITRRVSGYLDGVPVETIWWERGYAEERIEALLTGEAQSAADAFANGLALRTSGLLAAWQERLHAYPEELAAARIEDATLRWGGYAAVGMLTLVRPGDRLALAEWLVDAALRVQTIVYALNRVWQPTTKRLAARIELLAVKPERLAERIEAALTDPDSRRGLLTMTELQLETVLLAPSGPNVDRARTWLAEAIEVLC